ncbi:hypothetical protein ANO14919_078650 [Xylariales sp. No.14919]|nr:hypothetical protein ANO14919_078650 [Xylariales sp. No.14919]
MPAGTSHPTGLSTADKAGICVGSLAGAAALLALAFQALKLAGYIGEGVGASAATSAPAETVPTVGAASAPAATSAPTVSSTGLAPAATASTATPSRAAPAMAGTRAAAEVGAAGVGTTAGMTAAPTAGSSTWPGVSQGGWNGVSGSEGAGGSGVSSAGASAPPAGGPPNPTFVPVPARVFDHRRSTHVIRNELVSNCNDLTCMPYGWSCSLELIITSVYYICRQHHHSIKN